MTRPLVLAAKEALNNTLKHAQVRRVEVRLRVLPRELELGIRDDGVGFDPPAVSARAGGHNGLGNMRERMRLARGEIKVLSKPGEGTTVRLRVPLKPEGRE